MTTNNEKMNLSPSKSDETKELTEEEIKEMKKYESEYKSIKGTFLIYTMSASCAYCLESILSLTKEIPNINFHMFYSLKFDESLFPNESKIAGQISKMIEADSIKMSSIIDPNSIERNKYQTNYSDIITGKKNVNGNVQFHQIYPHKFMSGAGNFLNKKILKFDPNYDNKVINEKRANSKGKTSKF